MDDIWDEDMPDDAFVAQYQPTWQKVGDSSWYDPVMQVQHNYMGHSQAYYDSLVDGSSLDLPIWAGWGQSVMDSDDAANAAWRGSNTADTDEFLSNKAIGDGTLISSVISTVIGAISNAIDAVEEALSPGVKSGNVSFGPLEVVPDATLAQQGYSSGSVTASATTSAASSSRASDPTLSNAGSAGTAGTTAPNSAATTTATQSQSLLSAAWNGAKQGLYAALDGANPFGNPLASAGLYDANDPDLKASKAIGTYVVAPAATVATGAAIWSAAGGSTATVYVGSGTPFHVALEAGGTTVHSLGEIGAQVFTTKGAEAFAATSWFSVIGIPVASTAAATTTGYATTTCVGGVATALARGWGWPWF